MFCLGFRLACLFGRACSFRRCASRHYCYHSEYHYQKTQNSVFVDKLIENSTLIQSKGKTIHRSTQKAVKLTCKEVF